jgi:hypothetical protein
MNANNLSMITAGSYWRGSQAICSRPYALDLGGQTWTIATDGHVLVAVEGEHAQPLVARDARAPAAVVRDALDIAAEEIDLDALRAFCGPVRACLVSPCELCGLPETKETDDEACPHCRGAGLAPPITRPVQVRGQGLNAHLLCRALSAVPQVGTALAGWTGAPGSRYSMFVVRGDGWVIAVMATLQEVEDEFEDVAMEATR